MQAILLFLKGVAMGAANVIPGVSGGTIAFITGIYEEFINSLKSFDLTAAKLLFSGKLGKFIDHTNLKFLVILFVGVAVSIVSLAKLLEHLFEINGLLVWSFFFGLILASIYYVGRMVKKWSASSILTLVIGCAIAVSIAFLKPANENAASWYLVVCGVVAVASMILPGLSGSYVLILMGNYHLIMLNAASDPVANIKILLPVILGAIIGFVILSHGIAYVLKKYYNETISLLTGFVVGSLVVIWPWKVPAETIIGRHDEVKVVSYKWLSPDFSDNQSYYAIALIFAGILLVWGIEKVGSKFGAKEKAT